MNSSFPMEEQPFWAVIEQTRQVTTQQEQTQRLAHVLHALSPEQIRAFDHQFRSLSNHLFPSQPLRQLLINRHYTWGDDSWHYFLSWIIMQGSDVYTLAQHASPDLLLMIDAHSTPATLPDIPSWFRPRWLPDFEGSAYVAGKVYLEKTGHEIEEDEAQEDEQQQKPEPNEWEALRIARSRGRSLLFQGLRSIAVQRKQEGNSDLNVTDWVHKQITALNRPVLDLYGTQKSFWSLDRHRYEEALEAIEQVLCLQPENLFAHRKKGQALQALGQDEEALAVFNQLIQLTPGDLSLFYEKGVLLFEAERYPEALAVFDQIFRRNPDDVVLHYYQGLALLHLGHTQEALGEFEQTVRLDPNYLPAYIAQGKLLVQSGHAQEALHACEQALRLDPQTAWAVQTHQVLLRHVERNDQ